jgi:ACS family hexuronate transporter-like MFS transporter
MKLRGVRWYIAALLFLSVVINYIDRQTLSVLAPVLTKELSISPTQYANILNAFLVAYTLMNLGSGFLVNRWGTRKSLTVFMGWWSASNMLHGFAGGVWTLGAFRFLLGMGEPGNFIAGYRLISEWYAAKERAFVNGLMNAGAATGAVIAPILVTMLAHYWDWRGAFVICGLLGLIWLIPWLWFCRPVEQHPMVTAEERALVEEGRLPAGRSHQGSWKKFLRYPQSWGLFLSRFVSDPVWWFYLFWLPKYMVETRGYTVIEMGMLAWMPFLSADLGAMFGGWMSGRLIGKGWKVLDARKAVMLPAAMIMPVSLVIALTDSRELSLGLICLVTFAHMCWKTNLATVTNDLYPVRVIGSVAGIFAFGNGLGGILFTALIGVLVQYFSYTWVFALMGVMHPLGYFIFRTLVRKPLDP